jgi:hypothetical protein
MPAPATLLARLDGHTTRSRASLSGERSWGSALAHSSKVDFVTAIASLSDAGKVASIIAAVGIVGTVVVWVWRRSRRRVFPRLRIEIIGQGFITVTHVVTVPMPRAQGSLSTNVPLRQFVVRITTWRPSAMQR